MPHMGLYELITQTKPPTPKQAHIKSMRVQANRSQTTVTQGCLRRFGTKPKSIKPALQDRQALKLV